jgi:hypothetical protein
MNELYPPGARDNWRDGKPWSVMDLVDLDNHVRTGMTADQTARFLSRSGTVGDVKSTAERRGLRFLERNSEPE